MLRFGFFDSEITGYDEEEMPIFDRAESSDFLAMFIACIFSDGVLAQPGDCFQVVAWEGMNLRIRPGFGIIRGRFAMDEQESDIYIPAAPRSYKRIDRVVLRVNYAERLCEIIVKEGTPAANPKPPELLRPVSGDYYELCLANITVSADQTVITQSNITDTRYDSRVCGVVTQAIDHLETSVFYAQFNQFYSEFVNRSNGSYDQFVMDMEKYLSNLKESGDSQLSAVVKQLADFETSSEQQWNEWSEGFRQTLESYKPAIEAYLDRLEESGDTRLATIVSKLTDFEATSEMQWNEWFERIRGMLTSVETGEMLAEVMRLFEEMSKIGAVEDIDHIIEGTYMDTEEVYGTFDIGTDQDIDGIINGTYTDT